MSKKKSKMMTSKKDYDPARVDAIIEGLFKKYLTGKKDKK
jgi:hypothetical protein